MKRGVTMNKANLYRLSALMYPDNVNSLNRNNIIKKIIESQFILNENEITSLEILPVLIKENFQFELTGVEISAIVCASDDFIAKRNGNYNKTDNCNDLDVHLTIKRYDLFIVK